MYLYLSLISGLLLGIYYILRKQVLNNNNVLKVLFAYSLTSWIIISYSFKEALNIEPKYLMLVLVKSAVIYISWSLSFSAVKKLPISIASSLNIMNPIFTILQGVIFLNEGFTYIQFLGIIIILISYFFIGKVGSLEVENIYKNKYLYFMILSMFLSSISALIDKIALKGCTSSQLQFWFMLFLAILYFVTIIVLNIRQSEIVKTKFNFSFYIILMSLVLVAADRIYFNAVRIPGGNISIIIPLRYISIVISTIGGGLIFKEKNIRKKFKYILVLLVGIVFLYL